MTNKISYHFQVIKYVIPFIKIYFITVILNTIIYRTVNHINGCKI